MAQTEGGACLVANVEACMVASAVELEEHGAAMERPEEVGMELAELVAVGKATVHLVVDAGSPV